MTSIPLSPVRKVVGNHRSLTGLFKSRKMQRVVPYESALERDLFTHLEWDLAVESYHAQPLRILYRHDDFRRAHVPDALAIYRKDLNLPKTGCMYQVKYSAELLRRWKGFHPALRAASRFAKHEGWEFRIATERDIRGALLDNLTLLLPFRDFPAENSYVDAIIEALSKSTTMSIAHLLAALKADRDGTLLQRTVWILCAKRITTVDLNKPITLRSEIWLT